MNKKLLIIFSLLLILISVGYIVFNQQKSNNFIDHMILSMTTTTTIQYEPVLEFENISEVKYCIFSSNKINFVCEAKQNNKYYVIYDGKKIEGYDDVPSFTFSPDSQHLAY